MASPSWSLKMERSAAKRPFGLDGAWTYARFVRHCYRFSYPLIAFKCALKPKYGPRRCATV